MIRRVCRTLATAACLIAVLAGAQRANAEPIDANIGLVLDGVSASHALDGETDRFTAPLPFLTIEAGDNHVALAAETLSTLGSLHFGDQATKLNILISSARVKFAHGLFLGAGEGVVNQSTTFDPKVFPFVGIPGANSYNLTENTRIVGMRIEAGYERGRWLVAVGVSPAMRGIVNDHCVEYSTGFRSEPCYRYDDLTIDVTAPETASEVDGYARYFLPVAKHVDAIIGLRYLNFSGRVPYADHVDEDFNRGTPIISVGVRAHTR